MAELLGTDEFLVNRDDVTYTQEQGTLMASLQNTDHMLVNRAGQTYKITGADLINSVVDPLVIRVFLAPDEGYTDTEITAIPVVSGGKEPDGGFIFDYQWMTADDADGTNKTEIVGQNSATYTPTTAYVGQYIGCVVTTTDLFGTTAEGEEFIGPIQILLEAPVIEEVVISEIANGSNRFTDKTFPYVTTMEVDGEPAPHFEVKAQVSGATFDFNVETAPITAVEGGGVNTCETAPIQTVDIATNAPNISLTFTSNEEFSCFEVGDIVQQQSAEDTIINVYDASGNLLDRSEYVLTGLASVGAESDIDIVKKVFFSGSGSSSVTAYRASAYSGDMDTQVPDLADMFTIEFIFPQPLRPAQVDANVYCVLVGGYKVYVDDVYRGETTGTVTGFVDVVNDLPFRKLKIEPQAPTGSPLRSIGFYGLRNDPGIYYNFDNFDYTEILSIDSGTKTMIVDGGDWIGTDGSLSGNAPQDSTVVKTIPYQTKLTLANDKDLAALIPGLQVKMAAPPDVPYQPVTSSIASVDDSDLNAIVLDLTNSQDLKYFRVGDDVQEDEYKDVNKIVLRLPGFNDNLYCEGLYLDGVLIWDQTAGPDLPKNVVTGELVEPYRTVTGATSNGTAQASFWANGKIGGIANQKVTDTPWRNYPGKAVLQWNEPISFKNLSILVSQGSSDSVDGYVELEDTTKIADIYMPGNLAEFEQINGVNAGLISITALDVDNKQMTVDGGDWTGTDGSFAGDAGDREAFVTCIKELKAPTNWTIENVSINDLTLSLSHTEPIERDQVWVANDNRLATDFYVVPENAVPIQQDHAWCNLAIISNKAQVIGLQKNETSFLPVPSKDYSIKFPQQFPTGNQPDIDLPEGACISVTVAAENNQGRSEAESNCFMPVTAFSSGITGLDADNPAHVALQEAIADSLDTFEERVNARRAALGSSFYRLMDGETLSAADYSLLEETVINAVNIQEPFALDGYYPLYYTAEKANAASSTDTHHTHTFEGTTYYMPDGATLYHGTYTN